MRYLQGLNWLLLAAATVMAITLSVVCLMFWVYRHEPIMQSGFPELLRQTGIFAGLTLVNATAALSLHYRKPGWPVFQLVMVLCLAGTVSYYLPG